MALTRLKNWIAEVLTASDLNAEFNNLLNYLNAGLVPAADGTVGAPGMSFKDDPDNGFYRIGANDWAASAGAVKILEFTAAGIIATAAKITSIDPTGFALNNGSTQTIFTMANGYIADAWIADGANSAHWAKGTFIYDGATLTRAAYSDSGHSLTLIASGTDIKANNGTGSNIATVNPAVLRLR